MGRSSHACLGRSDRLEGDLRDGKQFVEFSLHGRRSAADDDSGFQPAGYGHTARVVYEPSRYDRCFVFALQYSQNG